MKTSTTPPAVTAYVAACEPYVRDLDDSTQAQLRNDIVEIVSEVCGELEGAPEDLIGPPRRFVSELRGAAGLTLAPESETTSAATPSIVATLRQLARHRAITWLRELTPELRPAWWVARGVLVAWAVGSATSGRGPSWILNVIPHWPVFGSSILGFAAAVLAIYLSVEAGRRPRGGWRRLAVGAASVVAISFATATASDASRWTGGPAAYDHVAPPMNATVSIYPSGPTRAFSPVVIGSHLTSERIEVVDLSTASQTVDALLTSAPPASIYLEFDGGQHQPGSRQAIDDVLVDLVNRGWLNDA